MDKCCIKEDIKVSVIVATYKRNNELKNAIESLIGQTYQNIEIIVVDDNANYEWNVKVERIIEAIGDRRVIYIQNKINQGSAKTRNIGIAKASGEYITFLDDDDVYMPQKIETQLKGMLDEGADYSITDLILYNEDGRLSEYRKRDYLLNARKEDYMRYHLMYHMTGTDTMMFKSSYLNQIGGFDAIDIGDEFYLMQKAILNNGSLYYCPKCDVKAYVHTGEGGLSSGQVKIDGENQLFCYKSRFFDELDKKTIKYIKMRHYAVIGFAYLRINDMGGFILNGMKSFIASPSDCLRLVLKRKKL